VWTLSLRGLSGIIHQVLLILLALFVSTISGVISTFARSSPVNHWVKMGILSVFSLVNTLAKGY